MDEKSKQRFSDVIGGLVSGVAYARSVADMEAMRIAYFYHGHELLRGMPIPRLRIQNVSISLPIIVKESIPGAPAVRTPVVDVAGKTAQALMDAVGIAKKELEKSQTLKQEAKSIPDKDEEDLIRRFERIVILAEDEGMVHRFKDQLKERIEQEYRALDLSEGKDASDASLRETVGNAAGKIVRTSLSEIITKYAHDKAREKNEDFDRELGEKAIDELMEHPITRALIRHVRLAAEMHAVEKETVPPDFYVSVNTDEIKNTGGGPNVVTRLEMKLHEEGLEWFTEEEDGKKISKLTPE